MPDSLPKYVDPSFPNPNGPNDANFIIYGYTPNIVLAVIGAVFFGLCAVGIPALYLRIRRWDSLTFLLGLGLVCEVVGYVFRCLSSQVDPYRINFFVVQYFLIVVAPVFFAAAIYLALGRIIRVAGRSVSPMGPKAVISVFLTFDILTIIMQVAGAGWIGAAENNGGNIRVPENILIAGLAVQVASFSVYFIVWAIVAWNLIRLAKGSSTSPPSATRPGLTQYCRNVALLLGLVSLFVQIRTIFRLVESAQGFFAELSTHEIYFALLEFFPIALAMLGLLPLAWYSRASLNRHNLRGGSADPAPGAHVELAGPSHASQKRPMPV